MLRGKLRAQVKEGGKHTKYLIYYQGQTLAITIISCGAKEYSEDLLGAMSRQLKVSRSQLQYLLDCPWDYERYAQHVASGEH